jgi:peptide/nickel transport system substrate-binding protein
MTRSNYWMNRYTGSTRRRFLGASAVAGAGAASLALAGCGDDDKAASGPAGGAPPTVASAGNATPTPVADISKLSDAELFNYISDNPPKDWDDKDIKAGGTFKKGMNRDTPSYDFHKQVAGGVSELITPAYNGLTRFANRQGLKTTAIPEIEGDLASKWEQPDGQTIVFTLNPGIKWQNVAPLNGREFKTDDIIFSFNRGRTVTGAVYKQQYDLIDTVTDIGSNQIRVKLKQPFTAFMMLASTWPFRIMSPEVGGNLDTAARTNVGTGGFILEKYTPNVETVFKKNPDYFKKDAAGRRLPYVDGYTLPFFADVAAFSASFQLGNIETHYGVLPPNQQSWTGLRQFLTRNPKVVVQKSTPLAGGFNVAPHFDKPPFSDPRVRQALSLSLDRATILKSLYFGFGYGGPWFPWPAAVDTMPTLDQLGPCTKYDPKQAKELLAAAGFPNGIDIEYQWSYNRESEATLTQQFAAASGIRIKLFQTPDQPQHVAAYIAKNWKDLIVVGRGSDYPDPSNYLQYYLPGAPQNYGNVNDPVLTPLLAKEQVTTGAERRAIHKQIFERMLEQCYDIAWPTAFGLQYTQPWFKNHVEIPGAIATGTGSGTHDYVWLAK